MQVLVPVNELERAKGRLAEVLDPAARAALALATVTTVVGAIREAGHEPVLLTRDARVRSAFEGLAAIIDEDPEARGLNGQLESAIARVGADGDLEELLILHADLPLATAQAIRDLVEEAPPAPSVTLVRSGDGGTNAMLLRPPGRFALAYGANSFARHREAAVVAGMAVAEVQSPALALDVDTPADIERLMALPAGRASAAGKVLTDDGATAPAAQQ